MTLICVHRTPDEQMALEEMCYSVIRDLNAYGVCVLDSFLGEEKGLRVLSEVKKMRQSGMFRVSFIQNIEQGETNFVSSNS